MIRARWNVNFVRGLVIQRTTGQSLAKIKKILFIALVSI